MTSDRGINHLMFSFKRVGLIYILTRILSLSLNLFHILLMGLEDYITRAQKSGSSSSASENNSDKVTSHVVSVKHIDDDNAGVVTNQAWIPPDKKEMRRLLWKLDLRIVPYVSLLYLVSFLDRVNIGKLIHVTAFAWLFINNM